MKRLLGTILALSILAMAAAQSEVQFEIQVEPIMAIALSDAANDVVISYALSGDDFVTMDATSFELRYITNKVAENASIQQENCEYDGGVDGDISCDDPLKAEMGQFLPAYITIAAGGWDNDGLYEVAAFADALKLQVTTAEQCGTTAFANAFAAPDLDGKWNGYEIVRPPESEKAGEVVKEYGPVGFSDAQVAWAKPHIGSSQAAGGFEIAFDGVTSYLIGNPDPDDDDAGSLIRGAVCGEVAGQGWDITLEPVRVGETILPAGDTPVAVQITIHDDL